MTPTSNENILMMFEEINQKLDKTNRQIEKIGQKQPEENNSNDISELKSAIDNFHENQSEKLNAIENAIRTEKRKIEFTPTSTFGMSFFFSLMIIVLALSIWIYTLKSDNATLSDNDLKFRYFQMQGNATANDFAELDTVFYFNRNSKKIKAFRTQVEAFEENVRQRAKILEQEARLKREKDEIEKRLERKNK
ncbi:MAG: hypothetical protein PHW88_05680 [Bacteroidales bacterium]|jgi:hypothetical protein|nr:hypothetical protein [Bacteroidales bacterium]MDD2771240.1 hypothetical protein [Bacteroidales bacterium]MDD3105089.1 hypothetical protein [Bacteroidales bacterium]MDD3549931.1 hypothetical protein [Bacteroidales bacterium]MDY0182310.1 hypothetical protein [Proteiniphilum sp.]